TGIQVSDQDKILALTMGLPAAYDPVIINFDSAPPETLTFNGVVARLLNEETRQGGAGIKGEPEAAFSAGFQHQKPNRADVTCHFCDQKGHYKSECPERIKVAEGRK
ncbi:hypothetical protein R3P38DRAFT_2432485, partial [Favolaschia claudopus]